MAEHIERPATVTGYTPGYEDGYLAAEIARPDAYLPGQLVTEAHRVARERAQDSRWMAGYVAGWWRWCVDNGRVSAEEGVEER